MSNKVCWSRKISLENETKFTFSDGKFLDDLDNIYLI